MPTKELRWPMMGVVRRDSLRATPDSRGPWPAVWASNVRVEDPLDRRMRGGSRPGLTRFTVTHMGATIADIASINVSSAAGGAAESLFVLVDSAIKTVDGVTSTTQIAYLTDESGDILTDESDNRLVVGAGTAPSSGFLVTGQQHVFAVTTSGVSKMDPKTGQVDDLVASSGTIPTNCTFGGVYRNRFYLSGEDNAVYMSRQGDYTDWDYGKHVDDQGRALAFQLALSADVGAKPTAIIPCMDKYLICATARSLWLVQGDPTTGALQRISEEIGIIGARAWVKTDTSIVFLSEDGLYQVSADGSGLEMLTPNTIPKELRDIDTSTTTVTLGWDQERLAFHIYLRTAAGNDTHWLYEVGTQSFWPMRYQDGHSPLAVCQHAGELILAGNDGYLRKVTGDDDDGVDIDSHVVIGPLRLGTANHFGRLKNMHGMIAAGSGTVTWRIVQGNTAEEAADNVKLAIEAFQEGSSYASYVSHSGTWTAGRAIMSYPRPRSPWICLWLQSTDKWGFEGCVLETEPSGKWRGN